MDTDAGIADLKDIVARFCEERDWDQFHGPKDLAIGISTEASELLEHFRFLSAEQCSKALANPAKRDAIQNELADVLFFLLRFSQRFDFDLHESLLKKMETNAENYPIEKSRGRNVKYSEF